MAIFPLHDFSDSAGMLPITYPVGNNHRLQWIFARSLSSKASHSSQNWNTANPELGILHHDIPQRKSTCCSHRSTKEIFLQSFHSKRHPTNSTAPLLF